MLGFLVNHLVSRFTKSIENLGIFFDAILDLIIRQGRLDRPLARLLEMNEARPAHVPVMTGELESLVIHRHGMVISTIEALVPRHVDSLFFLFLVRLHAEKLDRAADILFH